jgi:ribose 5-phosphate isomerase B
MSLVTSIGSDHAGFEMKNKVIEVLKNVFKIEVQDRGCYTNEASDYPDYAAMVAEDVSRGNADYGILICGSGIGVSIVANRFHGIRACNPITLDQVVLAREHNNINVICFGSRISSYEEIVEMLKAFFFIGFLGGKHNERLKKIKNLEDRLELINSKEKIY